MTTETLAPPKTKSQALRSFEVTDFPAVTGMAEEWRFTPLKRLGDLVAGDGTGAVGLLHEQADVPALVTVEHVRREELAGDPVLVPFDRISALARARFGEALVVSVTRQAVLDKPVLLRTKGPGAGATAFGHTRIEVGALAEATLVLEQVGSGTVADNVEVAVGDGARLVLVTLADWEPDAVQAQHLKFRLGRDAKVTHVQVTLGGDLVRQFTTVEYTGRGGDAELFGLYFATELPADPASGARRGQHLEHRQLVDHTVPDCRSYVGYRGALQGEGTHTVWVGDVLIRSAATGTDTYEINRNLVLTDGARADSVPNLEIETGEVAGAGHAAATGRFDDEQLFYLMARGIPEPEARKLVVRGFFAELLNRIPVVQLRERLIAAIESRLTGAGG
ncbi:Fe-S cluster assembly protein SufD [Rhizomonospora bruguierae]|uniref:Fe-S cluster assembly protein SufD n=1 Tax=Rhizomonospora bruguierae TaxID=1581705 RepID=UPI001BD09721|nr:Fe-S cluster assembly protein SufD [Micromonospora sp. NBRC 107566]